jgi:hypothetical protein
MSTSVASQNSQGCLCGPQGKHYQPKARLNEAAVATQAPSLPYLQQGRRAPTGVPGASPWAWSHTQSPGQGDPFFTVPSPQFSEGFAVITHTTR